MKLGAAIRARREELGLTLTETAARSGVSTGYLSRLERGHDKWRTPSVKLILRLARTLGGPADEWLALSGRIPNDLTKWLLTTPGMIPELRKKMGRAA